MERHHHYRIKDDNIPKHGLPRTRYPEREQVKQTRSASLSIDNHEEPFRSRAFTWPLVNKHKTTRASVGDRQIFAVMANVAHIVIGVAVTQLGIVGTWYQRYMNFPKDQLRHVVYICVLFIILGIYGMCVVKRKLQSVKSHRIAYAVLSTLCIIASCFIIANGIRMLISDNYQTDQMVVVIFDGLMIGLAAIEVPVTMVGLYATISRSSHFPRISQPSDSTPTPANWCSIFSIILNVAHIVLGLCITELGMVGMMYRNFMNIDNTGLFAVVFVSISFISAGIIGIYNQLTEKDSLTCNRSLYTFASLVAAGCATVVMTFVSIAMSSKHYYSGIEAIVAFDVMILSMSSIELVVAIAAIALCLIPLCMSKLSSDQGSKSGT